MIVALSLRDSCLLSFFFIGLTNPTLKTIYSETGGKIRKLVDVLDLAFTKISPILTTAPIAIASFIAYFTTDLGADALELPYDIW